jgi:hypothetical protein
MPGDQDVGEHRGRDHHAQACCRKHQRSPDAKQHGNCHAIEHGHANLARDLRIVFDWVSWLVASARTVTASVCVPALPPTRHNRHQHGQRHHLARWPRQTSAMIEDAMQRRAQIGNQPADARFVAFADRLVDVAFTRAGQRRMSSPPLPE